MVLETCAVAAANAMISRIAGSTASGLVARPQDKRALRRALTEAVRRTDAKHGPLLRSYDVNAEFFTYEGADELARMLLPGPGPEARRLARLYHRSLGLDEATSDALVEPFSSLLDDLREHLGTHDRFRMALAQVAATRTGSTVELDERDLLEWVSRAFAHVRTAGLGGAAHVQPSLEEVFVAPRGVPQSHAGRRWNTDSQELRALLDDRLRNREISPEEHEAHLDRLDVDQRADEKATVEPVDVVELIKTNDRVVVLGDPGSGKTTLVKYLALRHATARLFEDADSRAELGVPRLPLYVRAGDFSRWPSFHHGLRAFIAPFTAASQCPVSLERLERVIDIALRAGRCLLLVDGLDEVTSAQDRARVVTMITAFVTAQHPRGNKIVCTSRTSGYLAAALPSEYMTVALTEMDDETIRRFLDLYVPAIELAETGGRNPDIAQARAQDTIEALLGALRSTPGVRRLAANPLLLTALLLVHRTRGRLPQRRVDAYKAVTDALAHSWRAAQGVPTAALPDDQHLTTWLTGLAAWMHRERPEGSATVRDLLALWGPMWAEQHGRLWDRNVLDTAEPAATEPGRSIIRFAEQIEEHCGLLVERAPRRWGFPHLTYEEFYAGRALAFEGRARTRPRVIREHLHDPRYDEPILLALGLLGRDQPEELDAVFRAAVLATGEDATDLDLHPSAHEDLLARDFRFALRSLADDIPITPSLVDRLLGRAITEVLDPTSNARFPDYREALLDRLAALKHLRAGTRAGELLARRVSDGLRTDAPPQRTAFFQLAERCTLGPTSTAVTARLIKIFHGRDRAAAFRAAHVLAGHGALDPDVIGRLTDIAAGTRGGADMGPVASVRAAEVLGGQCALPPDVLDRLTDMLHGEDSAAAVLAAEVLGAQGALHSDVLDRLTDMLHGEDSAAAVLAAHALRGQGALPHEFTARLSDILNGAHSDAAVRAAELLGGQGALPPEVLDRLTNMLNEEDSDDEDSDAAVLAAQVLGGQDELPPDVLDRLCSMVNDHDFDAAVLAAQVLGGQGALPQEFEARLTDNLNGTDPDAALLAAELLGGRGALPPDVLERLTNIARRAERAEDAVRAMNVLDGQGALPWDVLDRLIHILTGWNAYASLSAARILGRQRALPTRITGRLIAIAEDRAVVAYARGAALTVASRARDVSDELVAGLRGRLGDPSHEVRRAAVGGLVDIARDARWRSVIERLIVDELADPAFALARVGDQARRSESAYAVLWQIGHGPRPGDGRGTHDCAASL